MQIPAGSSIELYENVRITKGHFPVFESEQNKLDYFANHVLTQYTPCTYIKHTGAVRVELPLTTVQRANYLSFINPSFENIIWYGFITDWQYVNNERTDIFFVLDPFMTYMHVFAIEPCMISRQGLSTTDWTKATTNPYRTDVLPLQTPEDLSTDPSLEIPVYHLKKYTDSTETDGEYLFSSREVSKQNAYEYDMGAEVMGVFFLAPIDFSDLGDDQYYGTALYWQLESAVYAKIQQVSGSNMYQQLSSADWASLEAQVATLWADAQYDVPASLQTTLSSTMTQQPPDDGSAIAPGSAYGMYLLFMETCRSSGSNAAYTQYSTLIQDIVTAGGYSFLIGADIMSHNMSPYSAFPRGYNIVAIPGAVTPTRASFIDRMISFLTQYSATHQIVGLYAIPKTIFKHAFWGDSTGSIVPNFADFVNNFFEEDTSKERADDGKQYAPDSPKLYRAPFSFMRMKTPTLDVKEFYYEDFENVQNGGTTCKFRAIGDLNSRPSIIIAPVNYKESSSAYSHEGYSMTDAVNINLDERLEYTDFAQIPFVTDAYLTYLAGQVMATTAANTMDAQDQRSIGKLQTVFSGISAITNGLGQAVGAGVGDNWRAKDEMGNYTPVSRSSGLTPITTGLSVGTGIAEAGIDAGSKWRDIKSSEAQITEANKWLNAEDGIYNEVNWGRYNDTKPAFANNQYHPGTNGGIYQYIKGLANNIDFKLYHVQLKEEILRKYDRYFAYYGYNYAGMAGTPLVYDYIHGTDNIHWETLDDGSTATYIQTMGLNVSGIPAPWAAYIENLFNSGIILYKGETLDPQPEPEPEPT